MSHLRFLFLYADTQTTELGSALGLGLCWGVWLLIPFDTLGSVAVYRPMLALMPEWGWGLLFGAIGEPPYDDECECDEDTCRES